MRDDNGDSDGKHTAVLTEEGHPSGVRPETAVPNADKQGAKVSPRRRLLQEHPGTILAIVLALLLGGGYFIRNAFVYEGTDDAQVNGHVMPLSARINGYVHEVPVIEGQLVRAGDALVAIDPKDYKIAVDQAQAHTRARRPAPQVLASTYRSLPLPPAAISTLQVLRS
jgi:membrane fusion protein (multidrug efflux system)